MYHRMHQMRQESIEHQGRALIGLGEVHLGGKDPLLERRARPVIEDLGGEEIEVGVVVAEIKNLSDKLQAQRNTRMWCACGRTSYLRDVR